MKNLILRNSGNEDNDGSQVYRKTSANEYDDEEDHKETLWKAAERNYSNDEDF